MPRGCQSLRRKRFPIKHLDKKSRNFNLRSPALAHPGAPRRHKPEWGFDFRATPESGLVPSIDDVPDYLGDGTASKPSARAHGVSSLGSSGANLSLGSRLVIDGFSLRAPATVSAWLRSTTDWPSTDHVLLELHEQAPSPCLLP